MKFDPPLRFGMDSDSDYTKRQFAIRLQEHCALSARYITIQHRCHEKMQCELDFNPSNLKHVYF